MSEYASCISPEEDGAIRLYINYRQLNKKIIGDRSLPLVENQLDLLQNAKYFNTFDLKIDFFMF